MIHYSTISISVSIALFLNRNPTILLLRRLLFVEALLISTEPNKGSVMLACVRFQIADRRSGIGGVE